MGPTKTHILSVVFIISLGILPVSAQSRAQQLYKRSLMNGVRTSEPGKKINIQVLGNGRQSLKDSFIRIGDDEMVFEANDEGLVFFELPATLKGETVQLIIYGKGHYLKAINVPFDDFTEVYKTIQLKKRRIFRVDGCPSF